MESNPLTCKTYVGRYDNTFAAIGIALLHRVFYRSQTVEKLTDIITGQLSAGEDLTFIKERYSPAVREAILQNDSKVSPRDRVHLLMQFAGSFTKMVSAKLTC